MTKEQIRQAADEFAGDRCKERGCPNAYRLHFDFDRHDIEKAFESGADWRVSSVWHDNTEKPGKGRVILAEYPQIDGSHGYLATDRGDELGDSITRWAYIDDLLPAKKGGGR